MKNFTFSEFKKTTLKEWKERNLISDEIILQQKIQRKVSKQFSNQKQKLTSGFVIKSLN